MLLGITLRRFIRSIVIGVAALGLAGAGVLGFSASAGADSAFTASFSRGVIPVLAADDDGVGGSADIKIAGTKPLDASIDDVDMQFPNTGFDDDVTGDCTNVDASDNSSTWSCDITEPEGGFRVSTNNTIEIDEETADGVTSSIVLSFDVYQGTDTPSPGPTVNRDPSNTVTFTPGGVKITTTSPPGADAPATQLVTEGEGPEVIADCGDPSSTGTNEDWGDYGTPGQTSVTCDVESLPLGQLIMIQSQQGIEGEDDSSFGSGQSVYDFFGVDEAPIVTSIVPGAGDTATLSGTILADDVEGPGEGIYAAVDILDSSHKVWCQTDDFDFGEGTEGNSPVGWTCPITKSLGPGTHNLYAVTVDYGSYDFESDEADLDGSVEQNDVGHYIDGGMSPLSNVETVTFAASITPSDLTPGDTTPNWSFTVSGDLTDLHPGDTITISGQGLPAGTSLDSVLHSIPTDLGTVVAAGDGTFTQTVAIPQDVIPGAHTIQVTASGPGLVPTTKQQAVTITAVPTSGGTTTLKPPSGVKAAGTGAGTGTSGNAAIQPNILTQALTPFADVAVHPGKIVSAIEIGLILLLLAVLPAHLLNATIAEQSDRFERRFKRFPKRPRWLTALVGWFTSAPVAAGLVVTLATAILFGFADPTFGWTLASLRLILACGIALFLVGYVANALTAVIARNQWHITVLVSTRPYGLILTIVGVLVSRLLHFSPGFLIGLILGLTIQGKSATGFAWRTVATRTSIVLLMSIAAWIGYSTLTLGGNEGGTFGTALLVETLVAITTEGVVALLVELLPLRFLEGERLYAHSRLLWGILYFLTVVVFVLAVIPWEGNWDALGSSLWVWLIVLAAFAVVCVGIYVYFRRFAKPLEEEEGSEEVALGESVGSEK
ncbi:MAG TPA: hypothetical protein VHZ81_15005 [Galbitalea sp.]|jgi:hypothetical protein|nr:hypothetical protein [Galbitalea sp.]